MAIPEKILFHVIAMIGMKSWRKYLYSAISGTSMASPQVVGILALAATNKRRFTQKDALRYIKDHSKSDMTYQMSFIPLFTNLNIRIPLDQWCSSSF